MEFKQVPNLDTNCREQEVQLIEVNKEPNIVPSTKKPNINQ
jgi:hypothetical protein